MFNNFTISEQMFSVKKQISFDADLSVFCLQVFNDKIFEEEIHDVAE